MLISLNFTPHFAQ